ncbi:MAG: ATP-binding protein [Solirubrobacteraceae bacterium]
MSLSTEAHDRGEAPVLSMALAPGPEAPSLARAAISGFAGDAAVDLRTVGTVKLLVSELVTNAVVHPVVQPPAEIRLVARIDPGVLRVEVTDRGDGFTPRPRDDARADRGYGLYLLDKVAARWGVDRLSGTTVWFELALPAR